MANLRFGSHNIKTVLKLQINDHSKLPKICHIGTLIFKGLYSYTSNQLINQITQLILTLTNVTRSSMVSTTSVMARYSSTFLQIRMIFLTSDSSKASKSAEVPCNIPGKYKVTTFLKVIWLWHKIDVTTPLFMVLCCKPKNDKKQNPWYP